MDKKTTRDVNLAEAIKLFKSSHFDAAADLCQHVLKNHPNDIDALSLIGSSYYIQQKYEQSADCFKKAVGLNPESATLHKNLGDALKASGKGQEALLSYKNAIKINPEYLEAFNNMGRLLESQGEYATAISAYQIAVRIKPDIPELFANLGNAFASVNDFDQAVSHYQKALDLNPEFADVYSNLGDIFKKKGKIIEAIKYCEKAIEINPYLAQAHNNLGNALKLMGRVNDAITAYEKAVQLKPDYYQAHSNLLMSLNYLDDFPIEKAFAAHRSWEKQHTPPTVSPAVYSNAVLVHKKLKIGYVSPDFRNHSVAYFAKGFVKAHDRNFFEIYCYANVSSKDSTTDYFKHHADHWRDIMGIKETQVMEWIVQDQIDILVDLAGHTADHSLLVFAKRPAPIQMTYIGYPNTTGLTAMNYRLTDPIADPPGDNDGFYTETLLYFPHCFLNYCPLETAPEISASPYLRNKYITFGSFNNLGKITPTVIQTWSQILKSVAGSKLVLKYKYLGDPDVQKRILKSFEKHGVPADALILWGHTPSTKEHLSLYRHLDICLDPFPYNGTTTTCDAMYMGVPVITLSGNKHAGRVGASILSVNGLEEFVCTSTGEYISKAVRLALDAKSLTDLRSHLRRRLESSPLLDTVQFTRNLEAIYRDIWAKWCHNQSSGNIDQSRSSPNEQQLAAPNTEDQKCFWITVKENIQICTPASIHLMTPYVLLEQEDWFEDEINFVRKILEPASNVIDIGANYGLYTLSMARKTGSDGKIFAFEPSSKTMSYLKKSVTRNGFVNITCIQAALTDQNGTASFALYPNTEINAVVLPEELESESAYETVQTMTMDHATSLGNMNDIAFVKLDAEGQETNIILSGQTFFSQQNPLVMFERKHGDKINQSAIGAFGNLGYQFYRLIPGLNILAPVDPLENLDGFVLNLFCCKPEKAKELNRKGSLVIVSPAQFNSAPPVDVDWQSGFKLLTFAQNLMGDWLEYDANPVHEAGWQEYRSGLSHYMNAHTPEKPVDNRFSSLFKALTLTSYSVGQSRNISRLQTLTRILFELGFRDTALNSLNILIDINYSDQTISFIEPFLPVCERFDHLRNDQKWHSWLLASLLEAKELNQHFSSYFTNQASLKNIENYLKLGFASSEMIRRYKLIKKRFKIQPNQMESSSVSSVSRLNARIWQMIDYNTMNQTDTEGV